MKLRNAVLVVPKTSFLWKLPSLPLTERFGTYSPDTQLAFDQELLISVPCGHVQLRNQLNPKFLYNSSGYSYRTGGSGKARRDVKFFLDYLHSLTADRTFKSAVDVGGNDLFVIRGLNSIFRILLLSILYALLLMGIQLME